MSSERYFIPALRRPGKGETTMEAKERGGDVEDLLAANGWTRDQAFGDRKGTRITHWHKNFSNGDREHLVVSRANTRPTSPSAQGTK
jgi:hypothetical protein